MNDGVLFSNQKLECQDFMSQMRELDIVFEGLRLECCQKGGRFEIFKILGVYAKILPKHPEVDAASRLSHKQHCRRLVVAS